MRQMVGNEILMGWEPFSAFDEDDAIPFGEAFECAADGREWTDGADGVVSIEFGVAVADELFESATEFAWGDFIQPQRPGERFRFRGLIVLLGNGAADQRGDVSHE